MTSFRPPDSDIPDWLRPALALAWKHRATVGPVAAIALAVATLSGVTYYRFGPTDIDRAECEIQKAEAVVKALDEESTAHDKGERFHRARAAEFRKVIDDNRGTTAAAWLEWHQAAADSQAQLGRAKSARRDNLFHLTAEYLRLIAEAECEILRAKDARDRGTPYEVTPRVRDLLAPVRAGR